MNKLMFMLAAVAMVIGAQANSVDWSATINGATTAGISASDYSVYLLDNSKWDTYVSSGKMDSAYLTDAAFDNAGFNENGTKRETGIQTAEGISAASINYAIVLVNSDASQYAVLSTGTSATYGELDAPVTISTVTTTGARIKGTASSGNLTWNAVQGGGGGEPEPTSGLLMLVGLGVLGLRRKMK